MTGNKAEGVKSGKAEDKCSGAVGEDERRAEREAGGGCCGECHSKEVFNFHFSFPDSPGRFLFSRFAGPRRAVVGSLKNECIKIQKWRKNYFYIIKIFFQKMLDACES